jgi:hypothetical protein
MLNDAFVAEQAEHFARRIEQACPASSSEAIVRAFRIALARRPNAKETAWCQDLVHRQEELFLAEGWGRAHAAHQALVQLCQTLLNTSEFLFTE